MFDIGRSDDVFMYDNVIPLFNSGISNLHRVGLQLTDVCGTVDIHDNDFSQLDGTPRFGEAIYFDESEGEYVKWEPGADTCLTRD